MVMKQNLFVHKYPEIFTCGISIVSHFICFEASIIAITIQEYF